MAHYVHHVPGRLRIQTPALKKNISNAQVFQFRHRRAKFLHLQLTQVLQYLHSLFLAQR